VPAGAYGLTARVGATPDERVKETCSMTVRMSRRDVLKGMLAALPSRVRGLSVAGALPQRPAGADRWTLPGKRPVRIVENEWIALADGTRLASRLWIPAGADREPVPVVWNYLPYRLRDGTRAYDDKWGQQLAQYGIAYARVDVRGTGDSHGVIVDEYALPELNDGVECIAWLARQPWSNGAVGMRGLSWGGINTLQIAAMQPPALKAIMPMGCCDIRYTDDAHYIGGALARTNFQWGLSFKGTMAGPPDPEIVGPEWETMWRRRLEATPNILATWLSHQHNDAYWQRGSIATDYSAITCPVYVVGGWQDTYTNVVGRFLEKLKTPRKALIGPWGHTYPDTAPTGLDWAHEEVRWWEHWLKGIDTGIMDEPMLRVFMPYSTAEQAGVAETPGRWVAEQVWPSPRTRARVWHLDAGRLSSTAGSRSHLRYTAKTIVGLTKPEWLNVGPGEQTADDRRSLTFDSAPLQADLEILGYPAAKIRVSADVPVAKLAVRLTEVQPDGKSWLVSYALRNLTHRTSHERPAALTPGEFYDVDLKLFMVAHRFRKGSRIRVAISESLWPLVWPSPTPVTLTIALGASTLALPVRPPEAVEARWKIPIIYNQRPAAAPRLDVQGPDSDGRITVRLGAQTAEITAGRPNSCAWRDTRTRTWKRGEADYTVVSAFELTSTEQEFHLTESLRAKKGDALIFEREKVSTIKRDLV
jgi:putative CocE/NonD family hydrolase